MLLSSNTDNGIIKSFYDSTNVVYSEYDTHGQILKITFIKGNTYQYNNVDLSTFNKLQLSESIGNAIFKYLKEHKFTNLGNVINIKLLLENAKTIKSEDYQNELSSRKKILIELMKKSETCLEFNQNNCLSILEELNKENLKIIELIKNKQNNE
jgi:hypothetical protein